MSVSAQNTFRKVFCKCELIAGADARPRPTRSQEYKLDATQHRNSFIEKANIPPRSWCRAINACLSMTIRLQRESLALWPLRRHGIESRERELGKQRPRRKEKLVTRQTRATERTIATKPPKVARKRACRLFYDCTGYGKLLRPKPGHGCVFCSYGDVPCPLMQASDGHCCVSRLPPDPVSVVPTMLAQRPVRGLAALPSVVFLYAFDLLELDGRDMRREPWSDRRWKLARLLRGAGHGVQLSDHIEGDDGEAARAQWASRASPQSAATSPIARAAHRIGSRSRTRTHRLRQG
jgi:hypothetical protein